MTGYLVGSGHFAIGFIAGAIIMVAVQKAQPRNLNAQLYMPFLPFVLGVIAALPYAYYAYTSAVGQCELPSVLNLMFFYPALHCNAVAIQLVGNLNVVALLCGGIYAVILLRYIQLVKHCRKRGWN